MGDPMTTLEIRDANGNRVHGAGLMVHEHVNPEEIIRDARRHATSDLERAQAELDALASGDPSRVRVYHHRNVHLKRNRRDLTVTPEMLREDA